MAVDSARETGPQLITPVADNEPEGEGIVGATMTLVEHLEELRRRIFVAAIAVAVLSIVSFIFWEQIFSFLLSPLPAAVDKIVQPGGHPVAGQGPRLVVTGIGESFLIAIEVSLAVGIALAAPIILYQVWGFIAPALTARERRYALPFTLLGVGLFIAGLATGFIVLRYPVDWLISFGSDRFQMLLTADSYFTFVAYFLLAFGIVFELPLVITCLGVVGIVNSRVLRAKRMYILFGLWLLSCFITPGADPYSPVIIGVAFTILFELSIILLRILKH
ncbi:MAG: twin-arginine translocase subunit TatC [Ktedonobacterales bacterium]